MTAAAPKRAAPLEPKDRARGVALATLDDVLGRPPARLDAAFAARAEAAGLAGRDRAFARLLATAALRRKGQLDVLLARYVRYLPDALTAQNLLRLGAVQLLALDTPAHAAVATTVALARARRRPEAGLVNAVLRKLAAERPAWPASERALPGWLWRRWRQAHGEEAARALVEAQLAEPPLDLTVRRDRTGWAERLGGRSIGPQSVRLEHAGAVTELEGFAAGAWWIQDVAATLPVATLGDLRGRAVLDAGAAPGGKTAQLAAAGAAVTALDVDTARLELVTANLARLGLQAELVEADLATWPGEPRFDVVLLDAPCSATGTIRRHPDIPWHRSAADIRSQAALQRGLLDAAARLVRPGGRLVFATCSLEPEEGEDLVAGWLRAAPGWRPVAARVAPPGELGVLRRGEGAFRTLPSAIAGGMDGFYFAHLERQA